MSQLWGVTALRLAQADVLPLDFEFYGDTINQFLTELEKNKHFEPAKLNLASAHKAARELASAAAQTKSLLSRGDRFRKARCQQLASINQLLMQGEANFILPEGIPGRPWFKHLLYSSRYTYAHLELPAITEAVESGNWTEAQRQTEILIRRDQRRNRTDEAGRRQPETQLSAVLIAAKRRPALESCRSSEREPEFTDEALTRKRPSPVVNWLSNIRAWRDPTRAATTSDYQENSHETPRS